ncbi:MAG: SpoIID/LytB domain-containing protein [Bradymonadaceae bacterium]
MPTTSQWTCRGRGAHWVARVLVATCLTAIASPGSAQQRQLTKSDRLAALYAPQLDFTRSGDPFVRVAIVEGRRRVSFRPSGPIRVMPMSDGGAEVVLPGDRTYTIDISNSRPGSYTHWVVAGRLSSERRTKLDELKETWVDRGYEPKVFQVGGLFGVGGEVFDSRKQLVAVGGTSHYEKARRLEKKLEREYGIDGRIHSELTDYPGGTFELSGEGVDAVVRHDDVLWIAPAEGQHGEIRYRVPEVPRAQAEGTESRVYTGRLIVAPDQDGNIALVNKLGVEKLLRGVVPSEIPTSAPKQALRAQAVAARNTILGSIGVRNLADPYMLRTDVYGQVYRGLEAEHPRTTRAVEATRGEVMFSGKKIINAVYSSNAGGFTADNDSVWNAEPRSYLRGAPDAPSDEVPKAFRDGLSEGEIEEFLDSDFPAYSRDSPLRSSDYYRWQTTVDASTPLSWLAENGEEFDSLTSAEVVERGKSGRAIRLVLESGDGRKTTVKRELNIRRLFGNLKSGLFVMETDRGPSGTIREFRFRGAGYGHGVGMCQTGAAGMAEQGHSYREILEHYYEGIEVRTLY